MASAPQAGLTEVVKVKKRRVNFDDSLPQGHGLVFRQAAYTISPMQSPFAVVTYTLHGSSHEDYELGMDMEKQIFLDHFDDPQLEALARQAAPAIVAFLSRPA